MGFRRIKLAGFEPELLRAIATGFQFHAPPLGDLPLVLDRHLFANFMPSAEDIAETASESDNGKKFNPEVEPALAVYTQPGSGIDPTSSSGSRLAFNLLVVLRIPATLQEAVDRLRDLIVWLEMEGNRILTENYKIVGYQTIGLPVPYQRYSDNKAAASATVRFLAVARL